MTTHDLYRRLQQQAHAERGSTQVWHEAYVDGHHLYMADTSFGDGPIFRCDMKAWQIAYDDAAITVDTTRKDLADALQFAERAEWRSRFESLGAPGK